MKFDIILPTISRPSLGAAIESVCRQTYPHWNLWVVYDNCEPHDYSNADARIAPLYVENNIKDFGSLARNWGLQAGINEWIAYIDDDDIWLEHHLTTIVEHVRMNPAVSMVRTAGQAFRWKHKHPRSSKLKRQLCEINSTDPMTVGIAHKRELFNLTRKWLPVDNHDHILWGDLLLAGGVMAVIPEVTFEFER